jgi:membrane peptidoglycan carboxypeptidase
VRRLPIVLTVAAALVYAATASLFLAPPVGFAPSRPFGEVRPEECGDPQFLAEVRREREVLFVPLAQIPSHLQRSVVAQEDRLFYVHHGVNWELVWRALARDIAAGEIRYGASTLTMQVARELFLDKRREVLRKLREMAYALQLERRLDKARILELYLNVVDWGPGVRGVGAASCYYFGIPPAELNAEQARRLVALLPSPERLGERLREELQSGPTPALTGS